VADRKLSGVRLVHLAGYTGPYAGSFIPMLCSILGAARERGWATEAVFVEPVRGRGWLEELDRHGLSYRFAQTDSRTALSREIRSLVLERGERTILHTHFTTFDVAAATAKADRRPLVYWHIHSRAQPELRVRIRNAIKYAIIGRSVQRILCVAPDIAAAVRRRGGGSSKVTFWPNAMDLDRFPLVGASERRHARAALGLPSEARVITHFGWDWARKGGDLYLEAVALLVSRRLADFVAVTVGGGDMARGLSARLGLDEVVRVLEPTDNVQLLYAAADMFVTPSRAEGMPFAMLEALASGLPVVATDIPGQRAVGDGLESCFWTDSEPEAIANAIQAALSVRPEVQGARAAAARERIRDQRSLAAWSGRLMELYEDALGTLRE